MIVALIGAVRQAGVGRYLEIAPGLREVDELEQAKHVRRRFTVGY